MNFNRMDCLRNAYAYLIILLIRLCYLSVCGLKNVENVDDKTLVQLITTQENVIVLFSKDKCPQCDEIEIIFNNIRNELKETIEVTLVKGHNSNMVNLYSPTKEPALVFFRHGVPLLYYGDYNEETIVHTFLENQVPTVVELSDENFEHLTQASTGATTGDWFVFFYSTDCVICLRLFATWEAVGAALKHRINVARIDRLGNGISTAKRFNVLESPELIFVSQGFIYRYRMKDYTPKKLIEFVESDYKKITQPESVPPQITLINTFFINQYEWLARHQQLIVIIVILAIIIMLAIIRRYAKREACLSKKAE